MDLAHFIVDAADVINIEINMHYKYKYEIHITPNSQSVLIEYNTMKYKISRSDRVTYKELITFIINDIEDLSSDCIDKEIDYGGYDPELDEQYNMNYVNVKKKDKVIYSKKFEIDNITKTVWRYLEHLQMTV